MSAPAPDAQKAAVVLLNLPGREAGALVARLEPEQARQLQQAICQAALSDAGEQNLILREFSAQSEGALGQESFGFLQGLEPQVLAPFLLDELPQTVAVVLVHASRRLAAGVLQELPGDKREAVIDRLASASQLSGFAACDVAHELHRQMADVLRTARHTVAHPIAAQRPGADTAWPLLARAKAG